MIGNAEAIIKFLFEQDRDKVFEVREWKSKRSLTQNAYFYALCQEIANKTRQSKEVVHDQMLKDYGQSEIISVLASIDVSGYFKYYDEFGTGTVNGKEFKHYKVYKGSSEMDSREMAILLDGVVFEAEQLGIPTLTETERKRLRL